MAFFQPFKTVTHIKKINKNFKNFIFIYVYIKCIYKNIKTKNAQNDTHTNLHNKDINVNI